MAGFGKSWRGLMEDLSRAVASEEKAAAQASWDRDNAAFSQSRRPEARGMTPTRMGVPSAEKFSLDDPKFGGQRMPLSKLGMLDPIDGMRPWNLDGPLEDKHVLAAYKKGAGKAEPFEKGAPWTAKDHAARIAQLMRDGWDDPITLGKDAEGFRFVEDGYHRLAAARLRGDKDIAYKYADDPKFGGGSALPAKPQGVGAIMGKLLASPEARLENAASAKVSRMPFRDHQMDVYDFPSGANVRFHPAPDGTVEVVMGASKVGPASPASLKAQVFADAMSAIERHAKETGAAQKGASYLFSGETDAITRMFRAMGERAQLPGGAVMHDSPGGFEISFDPSRKPFEGKSAMGLFDSEAGYGLGFNRDMKPSEIINARAKQLGGPMVGGTPEALARAREQGFDVDTPLYHGTNKDFPAFDLSKRGSGIGSRGEKAVFFTENPRDADLYGGNLFRNIGEPPPEGLATIPAYARGRIKELGPDDLGGRTRFDVHDFNLKKEIEKAKREGYDGLRINGMIERNFNAMGRQTAIFDPKNIRSRFAAFDPAKKDSSDLLASALLGTAAAGGATALGSGEAEAATTRLPLKTGNGSIFRYGFDVEPSSNPMVRESDWVGSRQGEIEVRDGPFNRWHIQGSQIDPDLIGTGRGVEMYADIADEAAAAGKVLYSDSLLTDGSRRIYPALARRGYDVRNVSQDVVSVPYQYDLPPDERAVFTVGARDEKPIYRIGPRGAGTSAGTKFWASALGVGGAGTVASNNESEAKPYAPKLAALSKTSTLPWTDGPGPSPIMAGKQGLRNSKDLAMAEAGVLASSPAAFSLGYYLLNDPTMQGNVAMDRAEQEWADETSKRTQQLREDYFKPHDPWAETAKQQTFNEKLTPSEQFNSWISPFFEAAASNVPDNALNPWQGESRKQLTGQDVQRTRDAMDESAFAFPLWAQSRAQQPIDLLGDALEMADPTWFGVSAARDWVDKRKTKRQALAAGLQKRKN